MHAYKFYYFGQTIQTSSRCAAGRCVYCEANKSRPSFRERLSHSDPRAAIFADLPISGVTATRYVCNTASHRWHVPRSGQEEMVPLLWTSRCGWAYGQTAYELRSDLPIDTPSAHICERCLPDDKAAARIHEAVEVPSSSCSSSSSDDAQSNSI